MCYTVEETRRIAELRSCFRPTTLSDDQVQDDYLIKWLRARQMSVEKARQMLEDSLEWRKYTGADTILENFTPPKQFLKSIPVAYLGPDQVTGCPVLLCCMGRYDTRAQLESYGEETFIKCNIYLMEYITQVIFKECSETAGKTVTQFIELVDFEHYSYRQLANSQCREAMIKMQKMMDLNYPEVMNHVTLVNTPKIFNFLYRLLLPFVAKATLEKITLCNSKNWQAEISSRFPLHLFPPSWGGSRPGKDQYCTGDPIWRFGYDTSHLTESYWTTLKVGAQEKVELKYEIVECSVLSWKFSTEGHDICYGIYLEHGSCLRPFKRVDSHKQIEAGTVRCEQSGTYIIVFDNSYSYVRPKVVKYRIKVESKTKKIR